MVCWQALLAAAALSMLALSIDGFPQADWNPALAGAFLYAGICGTALAHWAMVVVNRSLPAVTTSLGLLATPVVGVATSAIFLNEAVGISLILAMATILFVIAIGTVTRGKGAASVQAPSATATSLRAASTRGSSPHCRPY